VAANFEDGGIRFRYPENWRLEREENEAGWTVSLHSPDTAFVMVCFRDDTPAPNDMAEAALAALKDDYPELESEERLDSVAGQPATGYDVRFFSLDFSNTCFLRSFYTCEGTVLILWQANDLELERIEPVLRAICASVEVEED
jgi:hypothetical protein